jgi:hypothetical protein
MLKAKKHLSVDRICFGAVFSLQFSARSDDLDFWAQLAEQQRICLNERSGHGLFTALTVTAKSGLEEPMLKCAECTVEW